MKEESGDLFVSLARESLTYYLKKKEYLPTPSGLPDELTKRRAGAFVTLKKHGDLRGCIGTIAAVTPSLAEEIIRNAVASGTQDPRFPAVSANELEEITFSVDVLSDAEAVSSPAELDVKRYGVIVSSGFRRGLLLPNLEGVDTVADQIAIALRKAGISKDEEYQLERFEVVRHQ